MVLIKIDLTRTQRALRKDMKYQQQLEVLCRQQPEYIETSHLPQSYYTDTYYLNKELLNQFMESGGFKYMLNKKLYDDYGWTASERRRLGIDTFPVEISISPNLVSLWI